jgi:hypothetical protein
MIIVRQRPLRLLSSNLLLPVATPSLPRIGRPGEREPRTRNHSLSHPLHPLDRERENARRRRRLARQSGAK